MAAPLSRKQAWTKQTRRSAMGYFRLPVLTILVLGYFFYHVHRGFVTLELLDEEIGGYEQKLAQLVKARQSLEVHVGLLRDGQIEKDMLDEYARRNLHLSRKGELTLFWPLSDS